MLSFRRALLIALFKLSDVCIFAVTLAITLWFATFNRCPLALKTFFSLRIKMVNFIALVGLAFSWYLIFSSLELYRSRRLEKKSREWKDILKATTIGTAVFILVGVIFKIKIFSPLFVAVFWSLSSILTISFRAFLRCALGKLRRHGRNLRLVVIVGTNQRAYDFADKLEERKELGYCVIGYIDSGVYLPRKGIKLLGTIEDFANTVKKYVIDEVVIALPVKSYYEEIQRITHAAEKQGITIRYPFLLFDTRVADSRIETLDDFTMLTVASGPQNFRRYLAKRAMDVVLGTVLIIITFPFMVLAAIAIKLTSRGPILFAQERVGYNKRIFRLYKFRTMSANAEKLQSELEDLNEMDGPVFKIHNDPRITRVGRWLRRTSIDELPQLFNVLKGDMSLVGPRPLPVRDYNGFNNDWQRRRFSMPPGITCTWQISGRNNIPFERWMELDMEYIDNWKFFDDLKILLKTISAVIRKEGAV